MIDMDLTCKQCGFIGEPRVLKMKNSNGDIMLKGVCSECGKYIKFLPQGKKLTKEMLLKEIEILREGLDVYTSNPENWDKSVDEWYAQPALEALAKADKIREKVNEQ